MWHQIFEQDSLEDTKCGMIEIEKVFEKSWIYVVFICGILFHGNNRKLFTRSHKRCK